MESAEPPSGRSSRPIRCGNSAAWCFAYLGPLPAPELPRWDLFVWPNAVRQIAINVIDCNWLQCQENTGDPTHSVWAHGHLFRYVLARDGRLAERAASLDHTLHTRTKWGDGIKEVYARPTRIRHGEGHRLRQGAGRRDTISFAAIRR